MAASAYFWGSSTHTSRSASLTIRSTSRWCATSVESWSGRSSRTTPSMSWSVRDRATRLAASSIESRVVWCRGGMPSHSSSSWAPSLPHTQAVAQEVGGRRTPPADSSSPVSALNVDDLPEPVAPAIATTVWSAESRSRPVARSTTSCASSTTESSSRPRAASVADCSASIRLPRSDPRETSLRAPSSKEVIVSLGLAGVDRAGPTQLGHHPDHHIGGQVGARRPPGPRPGLGAALPGVPRVLDPARCPSQLLGDLRVQAEAVDDVGVARLLGVEELSHARLEGGTGPFGQAPDGLVAEDGLEQLLPQHGRAARDAHLGAGEAVGVGEDDDHEGHREPVDAAGEDPRRGALVLPLRADHLEPLGLPLAHRALRVAAQLA